MPVKKYTITLYDINIDELNAKYNLSRDIIKPIDINSIHTRKNVTKISELKDDCPNVTFLGQSKQLQKCNISMIDLNTDRETMILKYHCFWCKNPFNSLAIGCPIQHKPQRVVKSYTSNINQHTYDIKEPFDGVSAFIDPEQMSLDKKSYYQTDGVFCSFNCCHSFIQDNRTNELYSNSNMLLVKMYNQIFNTNITKISPAPHWKTLKHYGGWLDIVEFREGFNKIEYHDHGIYRDAGIQMNSCGWLYEKRIKF